MLQRLLVIFLFSLALVHASVIPESYRISESLQDAKGTRDITLPRIESRAPVDPKKPVPKPVSPKPATKPSPNSAPPAGSKPPPQTAPPPGKAQVFPKLPVPYKDDATDLCDIYINCNEEDDNLIGELKIRGESNDLQGGHYHTLNDDRHTLSKRRDVISKLPSGKLTLTALAYPESGALYTGPRQTNPKEVYDFKDNKLGTTSIKMSTSIIKPTAEYATEHIVELQTHAMFLAYAAGQDKTLDAFFRNKYVKAVTGTPKVANRPNKPSYTLGTDPQRDSLMRLVFEAMGTTANPGDFVLCESEINSYKERLWSSKELMVPKTYNDAVDDAMKGAVASSDFLSALRATFGVYGYMNSPGVVKKLKSINANIRLELSNAGYLYSDPKLDLVPMWDKFIAQKFTDAEKHGRKWLEKRFPDTKTKIEASRTKYRKLLDTLKKQEAGKDAKKHADTQKKTQTQLESKMKSQKALVTTAEKTLDDLKKLRTTGTAAQKQGLTGKIKRAKIALKNKEKDVGITQRQIHELYAHSVNLILENLVKDSSRVSNFEKAIAGLKLTPP